MPNYTPNLLPYSGQGTFRYWCQHVIPAVYSDALSYYELLCKVVNFLNNTIQDVDALETNVTSLATAYSQLQTFVNNYFDNLDVTEEINNKLDEYAADGTLSDLVEPIFTQLFSSLTNRMNDISDVTSALSARMDTFTQLPEGSTSGDAELADIRDWYDGRSSDTAGGAVRGQVSDVMNAIVGAANVDSSTPLTLSWSETYGYYDTTTGQLKTSNSWSLSNRINIRLEKYMNVVLSNNTTAYVYLFDGTTETPTTTTVMSRDTTKLFDVKNYKYAEITIRDADDNQHRIPAEYRNTNCVVTLRSYLDESYDKGFGMCWCPDGHIVLDKPNGKLIIPTAINVCDGRTTYNVTFDEPLEVELRTSFFFYDVDLNTFVINSPTGSTYGSHRTVLLGIVVNGDFKSSVILTTDTVEIISNEVVAYLGDSITYGTGVTGNNKYTDLITRKYGYSASVKAVGGTGFVQVSGVGQTDNFLSRASSITGSPKAIVVFGGTNDYGGNISEASFKTNVASVIDLLQFNKPTSVIIMVTPVMRHYHNVSGKTANSAGLKLDDYAKFIKEIAAERGVYCVDLYNTSGLNPDVESVNTAYFTDGLHPNNAGHTRIAAIIGKTIHDLMPI